MDDEIYDRIIFLADPDLNEPVLVIGLEGWIDAGLGASTAVATLLETTPTEVLATFDTEYFIDQRARRPLARIVDGITTELTWPEIQLRYGRDGDGADVLFLVGPEPDFHWSDFVDVVTDAAGRFDVRLVVGLGAFPAPTPHTRPVRVIGTAPAASAHLLATVGSVSGERVDELVTNNPEHSSMVQRLEVAADQTEGTSLGEELPSGDELAAELERFLRGESN